MARYPQLLHPLCWVLLASVVFAGCFGTRLKPITPEPKEFATHEEAASSHIAVLSVERWEDAKKSFQPDFKLTEQQALDKSLAATRAIEEQFLDSLQVALKLRAAETGVLGSDSGGSGAGEGGGNDDGGDGGGEGGGADGGGDDGDAGEGGGNDLLDPSTLELLDPTATESGGTRPTESVLNKPLSTDPMLDYLAATALYQEVQMLDRYVDHAVQKTGFEPYLVRLQVSLLPRARWEPYDAYVWFSFFAEEGASTPIATDRRVSSKTIEQDARAKIGLQLKQIEDPRTSELSDARFEACKAILQFLNQPLPYPVRVDSKPAQVTPGDWLLQGVEDRDRLLEDLGDFPASEEERKQVFDRCDSLAALVRAQLAPEQAPIVIPLLVTDNLESTLRSRAIDRIRQFAFGLGFLLQNVGGDFDVTRFQRDLQTVLGQDFNSLLTVARLSDNSYGVRLGAMQQTGTNYATIPRTHNLTLLLLVPQAKEKDKPCPINYPTVQLISQTQLFHAIEGQMLPGPGRSKVRTQLLNVAEKYEAYGLDFHGHKKATEKEQILLRLLGFAQQNRRQAFQQELATNQATYFESGTNLAAFPVENLWLDLISVMIGSRQASTSFDLPRCLPPRFPCEQTALVVDDGKVAATLLRDSERLKVDQLRARLMVKDQGPNKKKGPDLALPATKIEVLDDGATTRLSFPSPKQWKLDLDTSSKVELYCQACESPQNCRDAQTARPVVGSGRTFQVRSTVTEPDPPTKAAAIGLRVPSKFVRADAKGRGSLTFEVTTTKDFSVAHRIRFDISGADLESWTVVPADASDRETNAPATASESIARRRLKKAGVVTVHLHNLLAQSPVKIELVEIKIGKDAKEDETARGSQEVTVVLEDEPCCGRSAPGDAGGQGH